MAAGHTTSVIRVLDTAGADTGSHLRWIRASSTASEIRVRLIPRPPPTPHDVDTRGQR